MTADQQSFVAHHYAPRAQAYVTSTDHSAGADLDQMEAKLREKGQRLPLLQTA